MNNLLQGQKYIWKLPQSDPVQVCNLASSYNISFSIIQTLITRGLSEKLDIENYLFSSSEKDVAHSSLFKDAEKAVDRILYAIKNQEKILVCGDYDVDGITSSAMMMMCLLPLSAQINFFLPNRIRDGYGLSVKTVKRAAENNYKILITVDNGITAFEPATVAKDLGLDLIITDHHKPHIKIPDAFAVVNPHQFDCLYPYKQFAGVGVTFKVMSLLYEKLGLELPVKVYELLLLGTVADVVPLTGENRYWTRYCLQQVRKEQSFSLKVLRDNARLTKDRNLSSLDIGFFIAPQINALGRLEDARDGVKFLIGSDQEQVSRVGGILSTLNETRKNIERSIILQIENDIKAGIISVDPDRLILIAREGWQPGVIGLVASRLVGSYGKPVILLHITKEGLAKGSCRSIPEFNIFEALQEVSDILETFGGHAAAAGLSIKVEKLPELKLRLEQQLAKKLTEFDLKQKLRLDAELNLGEVNNKLIEDLNYLEPFGCSNSQPLFYLKNVSLIDKAELLKDAHVKCKIFSDGVIKSVIFFNRPELILFFDKIGLSTFHCAAQVTQNYWNGKVTIEFIGQDVALAEGDSV